MNLVRGLFAVALLVPLLAGCADRGADPSAPDIPLGRLTDAELKEPGYFAFDHPGGDITFRLGVGGQATVSLFDASDHPVATLGWRGAAVTAPGVAPGELVLRVLSINGTLDVDAGDGEPSFLPLGRTVERHVLVNRPAYAGPLPPGIPFFERFDPLEAIVPFNFTSPPDALRVLATGNVAGLRLEVSSGKDTVLTSRHQGSASPPQPYLGSGAFFDELPAEVHLENLSGLQAEAAIEAEHFDGALILEAETYTRARPPRADGQAWAEDAPPFVYSGFVEPFAPVRLQVADEATALYVIQDNATAGAGVLALFGPHDERVGTVEVPPNRTVRIPVSEPGEYVAVLLAGSAAIGADAAPADFDLHPVGTDEAVRPEGPPGTAGPNDYGQERLPIDADFVPFRVLGVLAAPTGGELFGQGDPFQSCEPGSLRLLAGGEPIGFWSADGEGTDPAMDAEATRLLRDGLEMERDGFGSDACRHQAIRLVGYNRALEA